MISNALLLAKSDGVLSESIKRLLINNINVFECYQVWMS